MKILKSLLALAVVVFIPFGLMLWYRMHQSTGFATVELIMYPLLFGGGSIILLYFLKQYFLKEPLSDFNSGKSNLIKDLLWGLGLVTVYFILFFIERITLSDFLKFQSNDELLTLLLDLRESPILLLIWLGPVLWIGIALYEELLRIFMLSSLWKFSKHWLWSVVVILLSALIMGLAHWSQGSYGIVTIAIKSLVSGYFFFKIKRLLPLVIAHALYDGIQVGLLLSTYP